MLRNCTKRRSADSLAGCCGLDPNAAFRLVRTVSPDGHLEGRRDHNAAIDLAASILRHTAPLTQTFVDLGFCACHNSGSPVLSKTYFFFVGLISHRDARVYAVVVCYSLRYSLRSSLRYSLTVAHSVQCLRDWRRPSFCKLRFFFYPLSFHISFSMVRAAMTECSYSVVSFFRFLLSLLHNAGTTTN